MLLFTMTFGGLLLMMGHHSRAESLFYYFRLEDHVPENHLLRLIDRHVSFDFVRAKLKASYSDTGRPSIDPELLLRMLLVGYLYGVTSERKLVEELRMHLAWRWFTGLGFDQEIPHHSTFSKNRHGRFQESNLFQELFEKNYIGLRRLRLRRMRFVREQFYLAATVQNLKRLVRFLTHRPELQTVTA